MWRLSDARGSTGSNHGTRPLYQRRFELSQHYRSNHEEFLRVGPHDAIIYLLPYCLVNLVALVLPRWRAALPVQTSKLDLRKADMSGTKSVHGCMCLPTSICLQKKELHRVPSAPSVEFHLLILGAKTSDADSRQNEQSELGSTSLAQ